MFDLNFLKKHLNIDQEYTGDDLLLEFYRTAAIKIVEQHLNKPLAQVKAENNGIFPKPLELAMMLIIGDMYQNREGTSSTSMSALPHSYDYIMDLYKCYYNEPKEQEETV